MLGYSGGIVVAILMVLFIKNIITPDGYIYHSYKGINSLFVESKLLVVIYPDVTA